MNKENKLLNNILFIINVLMLIVNIFTCVSNSFTTSTYSFKTLTKKANTNTYVQKINCNFYAPYLREGDFELRFFDSGNKIIGSLDSSTDLIPSDTKFNTPMQKYFSSSMLISYCKFYCSFNNTQYALNKNSNVVINGVKYYFSTFTTTSEIDNGLLISINKFDMPSYSLIGSTNTIVFNLMLDNKLVSAPYYTNNSVSLIHTGDSVSSNVNYFYVALRMASTYNDWSFSGVPNNEMTTLNALFTNQGWRKADSPLRLSLEFTYDESSLNGGYFASSLVEISSINLSYYSLSTYQLIKNISVSPTLFKLNKNSTGFGYVSNYIDIESINGFMFVSFNIQTNVYGVVSSGNYEVIDLPNLLFTIVGLPFAFITGAFGFTLFSGTPYAINLADVFMIILTIIIFIWLIKLIMSLRG